MSHAPKDRRCPTCHRRYVRGHEQNAKYWLLLHLISERIKIDGQDYRPDVWHEWAKSRFIGRDEVHLPNGKDVTIIRSSADLDVDAFSDYMTKVEAWAAERGVFLEDKE